MKNLIIFVFAFFTTISSYSQSDCKKDLKEALSLYDKGLFQQAIDKLSENILKCDFSSDERQDAIKTLISSYIEVDDLENAHIWTLIFLHENPIYKPLTIDNLSFVNSIKKYDVKNKFTLDYSVGINQIKTKIENVNAIWEQLDYNTEYETFTGFQTNIGLSWHFSKSFFLQYAVDIHKIGFNRNLTTEDGLKLKYRENSYQIKFPLLVHYSLLSNYKIYPSFFIGIYYSTLLTAKSEINFSAIEESLNFDMKNYRNANNYGYIFGAGINYAFNRMVLNLNFNYLMDYYSYTDDIKKYKTGRLFWEYLYVDNKFSIHYLNINLGLSYRLSYKIKSKY